MSNRIVPGTYRAIIDDVMNNIKVEFDEFGLGDDVLEELQSKWESKVIASNVADFEPPASPTPRAAPQPRQNAQTQAQPVLSLPTLPGPPPGPRYGTVKREADIPQLPSLPGPPMPAHMNGQHGPNLMHPNSRPPSRIQYPPPNFPIPNHLAQQVQHLQQQARAPPARVPQLDGPPGRSRIPQLDGPGRSHSRSSSRSSASTASRSPSPMPPPVEQNARSARQSEDGEDDEDEPAPIASTSRAGGAVKDEDKIDSELDDDDEDADDVEEAANGDGTQDIVFCTYDKVARVKNKWKVTLKDGMVHVNGKDYLFSKCNGEFEW